jgi:hypothetical protein
MTRLASATGSLFHGLSASKQLLALPRADTIGIVVKCAETDDFPDGQPVLPGYPGDEIT